MRKRDPRNRHVRPTLSERENSRGMKADADARRQLPSARALRPSAEQFVRSVMAGRGGELAAHAQATAEIGEECRFASPRHPWRRGASENAGGLLGERFPKGCLLAPPRGARRCKRPAIAESQAMQAPRMPSVSPDPSLGVVAADLKIRGQKRRALRGFQQSEGSCAGVFPGRGCWVGVWGRPWRVKRAVFGQVFREGGRI